MAADGSEAAVMGPATARKRQIQRDVRGGKTKATPPVSDAAGLVGGEAAKAKKLKPHLKKAVRKYERFQGQADTATSDKKLRRQMGVTVSKAQKAALDAAHAEILLPEEAGFLQAEGLERTFKFSQPGLAEHVDESSARKIFSLQLDQLGPYAIRYSRNGRFLLMGGRKGHVGAFDWQSGHLRCEMQLRETVRDVQYLHNESLFAVAQRRHVYIYDSSGNEVNYLAKHIDPLRLEFLSYHFLLVSIGNAGYLKYHDVSTGQLVAETKTRLGPCHAMRQNPWNAVVHCGHTNGTVTLWSPNLTTPLVKQLCHKGPVNAVAVDPTGFYMATAGADCQLKLWDIRMFKDEPIHAYFTPAPAASLDVSQKHLLAVAFGSHVHIWKSPHLQKQQSPYMYHHVPGAMLRECRFCPYEDVLGIGHSKGFDSIVVPGAGEPNFDSLEANPYQTSKQRKESEVKQLLDKIPASLIALDPRAILKLDQRAKSEVEAERAAAGAQDGSTALELKNRKRGRSTAMRRYLRKQINVVDERREKIKQRLAKEKADKVAEKEGKTGQRGALDRFSS